MANPKEQISARLTKAKAELDEALVEIERLPVFEAGAVAFGAHALKNFLTVTTATTELLQLQLGNAADPEVNALLAGLRHTTELMTFTVARLINAAARSDAPLKSQAVDLVVLTQWGHGFYQRIADRKQMKINLESAAPSVLAWTDPAAIGAVLDNLLTNAIKYSPPGKQIWVRLAAEPGAVVCSVQDEGPGLSPEDQARLFQRGVQLTPRPTGGESSTGYGLAVAKEIVTRVGGTIWCDSQLGAGARFSFRLPAPPKDAPATAPSPGTGKVP
jgi:signal transduction histidine kinase